MTGYKLATTHLREFAVLLYSGSQGFLLSDVKNLFESVLFSFPDSSSVSIRIVLRLFLGVFHVVKFEQTGASKQH